MHRPYCCVLLAALALPSAWPCAAAVIAQDPVAIISVSGGGGLAVDPQAYDETIDYAPGEKPRTVSLSRAGESSFGGQTAARFSSSASQTSTLVVRPGEVRATLDAAMAVHGERLASLPVGSTMTAGAYSTFEIVVDVTDGPAEFSFSGTLRQAYMSVVKSTPTSYEELHSLDGRNFDRPFDLSGVIQPARYTFKANMNAGVAAGFPFTFDTTGSVRGMALRVWQVPEPAIGCLIAAGAAGSLLRRRTR